MLRKIGELKASLSSAFVGASVYTNGAGKFIIRMREFFVKKINSTPTDFAIVRGIIAEQEGVSSDQIQLVLENVQSQSASASDDLENLFK